MNSTATAVAETTKEAKTLGSLWSRARAVTTRQEMSTLLLVHGIPLLGLALGWHPLAVLALVTLEILINQSVALVRHVLAPPWGAALGARLVLMPIVAAFWCAVPLLQAHAAAATYLALAAGGGEIAFELMVLDPTALPRALADAGLLVPALTVLLVLAWEAVWLLAEDFRSGRRPDAVEPSLRILLPAAVGLWMQLISIPLMFLAGFAFAILDIDPHAIDFGNMSSGPAYWLVAAWAALAIVNKFFVEWALIVWRRHRETLTTPQG